MKNINKNVEFVDERGKKHEFRQTLENLVGQKVEFSGRLVKCYEDSKKLLVREINDKNGQFITSHSHMFIQGNPKRDKERQKIDKMFSELQKFEGKKIRFIAKVTKYSTKSQKMNYGISYFVELLDK